MIHDSEIEFYKTILPKCRVVFDVGCRDDNIFHQLDKTLQVHMFDPNGCENTTGVKFNHYALGSKKQKVDFRYRYGSILHRTDEPKFNGMHDTVEIEVDTILNYCKKNRIKKIDLLKIDTEGYDFEVIKGCGEMIKNIKYIQFEYWDTNISGIINYFTGYNIYEIGGKPLNLVATKETLDLKLYDDQHLQNLHLIPNPTRRNDPGRWGI